MATFVFFMGFAAMMAALGLIAIVTDWWTNRHG